jgi:hypothetical protein
MEGATYAVAAAAAAAAAVCIHDSVLLCWNTVP